MNEPATTESAPSERRGSLAREGLLLGALALSLYLLGNGQISLWDRDEPRYAVCTREMRASGDFIFPTFNDEPRFHKPVLIYWLMLGGTWLAGDSTFGARLVSAIAGTCTVMLVWWLGRRMFGAWVGRWAGIILATAPIMVAESKLATTDATLALFLTGCQFCLWELSQRASKRIAALFWMCLALATLTKGPVGPAIIGLAGAVSWWWRGPTACWSRIEWKWGVPLAIAIVAPWYIAIGILSNGDFYRVAMGYHVVERMARGIEQHGGFPGFYIVTAAVLFFPWSALVPPALHAAWSRRKENPAFGFLLGWVVGPLVLLELVQTKLVHYYLPAYAGVALLCAWFLKQAATDVQTLRRWPLGRLGVGLLVAIGLATSVGLFGGAVVSPGSLRWAFVALGLVVGGGTVYAMERLHQGATLPAFRGLAIMAALVAAGSAGWLLPALEPYRLSRLVGERLAEWSEKEGAKPVLATYQQPSVIFYLGQSAPRIRERADAYQLLKAADRPIVTALSDPEIRLISQDERVKVELKETISGFNVDKGRSETLKVAVLSRTDEPGASKGADVARGGEQPLVK